MEKRGTPTREKNTLSVANNSSNDVDGHDIKVGGRVIVEPRKELNFQRITKKTLIKSLKKQDKRLLCQEGTGLYEDMLHTPDCSKRWR